MAASGEDALAAAGWTDADIAWEAKQEQAATLAAEGKVDEAARLWAEALFIARQSFAGDDPRLAAGIANHAFALDRSGDARTARTMFEEALTVWDASGPWRQAIRIERRARSSLYHLRMEARHWETYERTARARLQKFADEGRAAIAALAAGTAAGSRGVARWWPEKPSTYNDSRKLLAAVLLIVRRDEIGTDET